MVPVMIPPAPACPHCEYDLAGLLSPDAPVACPECGKAVRLEELRPPPRSLGAPFGIGIVPWVAVFVLGLLLPPAILPERAAHFVFPAAVVATGVSLCVTALAARRRWRYRLRMRRTLLITASIVMNVALLFAAWLWSQLLAAAGC